MLLNLDECLHDDSEKHIHHEERADNNNKHAIERSHNSRSINEVVHYSRPVIHGDNLEN
jgi:hypothetical protein